MRRKNMQDWVKKRKNVCSAMLLAVILFLQTALPVCAGANEVVKDTGAEECVEIQLPVEQQQQIVSEDEIISVSMPLQTPFTMNPTKSFGEEQIWSPEFHFQNNSRTAVKVTVKNIRYVLKEDSKVVTHYQPFDGLKERKKKEIYLCLRFGDAEVPVGDLSREYSFTLAEAGESQLSKQEFSIEGMMSCYPEEEWQDGDVSIAFQVEYRAVIEKEAEGLLEVENETDSKAEDTGKQAALEKEESPFRERKDTDWQKNLIGILKSGKTENGEEKTEILAYIIDTGKNVEGGEGQKPDTGEEKKGEKQPVSFDWKKLLDEYEKYANAIPEGAVLLLDVNETAKSPAGYLREEGLEGLTADVQNANNVYVFWKNPDYVPEENKVWHIEDDVPYYISNPEQPWLWAAAEEGELPADTELIYMWLKGDTDGAYPETERNAVHGLENDIGDKETE